MSLAAGKKKNTRSKSLSPSSINPYNQRRCKYGHPNKKIDTSSSSLQCADCKSKIKKYGIVYGCQRCKFYICSACFRKPSCANGHHLKATHVKRGTLCSSCQYKSKKQRLQMYQCNQCKYQMCLGCYSYETCCGNHGLKWQKITSNTHKSMNHCKKCQRIFKINKSLFMCKKCKYSLCGDCYQPSLTLKSKIHRQQKIAEKIKSDHNNAHNNGNNLNSNNGINILPQPPPQQQQNQGALPLNGNVNNNNTINIIPLSPPNQPILNMLNPDHLGGELKNDDDDVNRMYFDQNEEEDDQKKLEFSDEDEYDQDEEEEEKKMVLTDDHLAHHNNNYNYNSYSNPIGPSSHQYTQSYHSYSHSNSHQSLSAAASNAASRSKSRERQTSKKKKKKKSNKIKDGNNGSKRKKKKSKSTKTRKKNTKNINNIPNIPNNPNAINGNTPSLSLSATSSVNMQYNEDKYELSSSSQQFELSGLESIAPSEMTRIPSILTDCCICMERDKEVAFLPCGHYISCEQCAKALKGDTGMCAICSAKIHSIVKIYE